MNRGYQHNLKEKLLSEINETHRNWKSALLKQYSEEENEMLPFVTQYQPLVSTVKEALMEKWNLIQNQPLLCQIFKEPPIIFYKKGVSWQRTCLLRQNIKGQHTVSRRYRCAACHPLQFFTKNNSRIQNARVGVSFCVQLTSLHYFL